MRTTADRPAVPLLDLAAHHRPNLDEFREAIDGVIASSDFSGGNMVAAFEREFAEFCGTRHAVGVGSGTEALWLALLALGIGVGDEVITVPNTFVATAEAIVMAGARPVFADVREGCLTMDPESFERAITPRTKAVIPVHLFGRSADMEAIVEVAQGHGLAVVEDAAQAHGAKCGGRRVGSIGDLGCFSFYPGKNLGAFGDAGAVVTDRADLAAKLGELRDHGRAGEGLHPSIGWNARMDGIQAAVLSIKLRDLDANNRRRAGHAARYDEALAGLAGLVIPMPAAASEHVYHHYVVRVRNRDAVRAALDEAGIGHGVHYPVPIHLQEAFGYLGYGEGSFPVAEKSCGELLSLPVFPELGEAEIDAVCAALVSGLGESEAA